MIFVVPRTRATRTWAAANTRATRLRYGARSGLSRGWARWELRHQPAHLQQIQLLHAQSRAARRDDGGINDLPAHPPARPYNILK